MLLKPETTSLRFPPINLVRIAQLHASITDRLSIEKRINCTDSSARKKKERKKRGIERHTLRAIERVKWPANFDTVWEAFVA